MGCKSLFLLRVQMFTMFTPIGARKDDAGVRVVRPLARIDGTDYEGGDQYLASSFLFARHLWEQNPDTSAAWTQGDIDDAEFGYKIQS